ncbi:helix-turn-helix domain-containing protein [Rhizobium sp. TRM95111]|uniref:helix-turn-helix domain-containing protein n=1 Tax=Rhizobium alarense TaxID=2846851 RepID=UPI001F41F23A|nr:helix-turn-helix domain-containing protein [Rhizobium alarense]MCF3638722.1 helix-turn-helix domain-containing protein [Rhizobium alarense]
MSDALSQAEVQSFTSWKLDIIDAMSCDAQLDDIDFRVAFRMMQHVNAKTRDAHPSLERLAAQLGVHRDTVMRSLNRMCDPNGGRQWLSRRRNSRIESYCYSFVTDRLNAVIDGKLQREDQARETAQQRRRQRLEVARKQPRDVAPLQSPEVANVQSPEVAPLQPKHLTENYLNRTPSDSCSDGREVTYPRGIIPSNESDFGSWISRNIPDPTKHREALRLLHERKMTPEVLRRMAA